MTIAVELNCQKEHCRNCEYQSYSSMFYHDVGATCDIYNKHLVPERDIDGSFIAYKRLDECYEAEIKEENSIR